MRKEVIRVAETEGKIKEGDLMQRMVDLLSDYLKEDLVELYNRWFDTKLTVDDVKWVDPELELGKRVLHW